MLWCSSCGPQGDPAVVCIDEDRSVHWIARTFEDAIECFQGEVNLTKWVLKHPGPIFEGAMEIGIDVPGIGYRERL